MCTPITVCSCFTAIRNISMYWSVLYTTASFRVCRSTVAASFIQNPLASTGGYSRKPWFGCACCPSNISRFIPSLPGYIYAVKDNSLFVNLFMPNTAKVEVGGKKMTISQQTSYPWNGNVKITVDKGNADMAMKIRIPGWVRNEVVPAISMPTPTMRLRPIKFALMALR